MAHTKTLDSFNKLHEAIRELNAQGIGVEYSMKKEEKQDYKVIISKIYTATIPIQAISPRSAKDIVLKAIEEGKIECAFGEEPIVEIDVWDATY